MASVPGSILTLFKATPALVSLVPGGLWFGYAPTHAKRTPPYGSMIDPGSMPWLNTSGQALERAELQCSFYGEDPDVLKQIETQWQLVFNMRLGRPGYPTLTIDGKTLVSFLPGVNKLMDDPGTGPSGNPLYHQMIAFTLILNRALT